MLMKTEVDHSVGSMVIDSSHWTIRLRVADKTTRPPNSILAKQDIPTPQEEILTHHIMFQPQGM